MSDSTDFKGQNFVTDDLNLAAILLLNNIEPLLINNENPGKSLFEFEFKDDLIKIITAYFNKSLTGNIPQFLIMRRKLVVRTKSNG